MAKLLRYIWAGPTTMLGLVLAGLALRGGRVTLVDGVVEAHGPMVAWALSRLVPLGGGVQALTLGHVVLGRDARMLEATRAHERVHVSQCERWGALFVPAYLAAGAWALVRGRHPYFDNPFELEAQAAASLTDRDVL
jgi:hypothetical protein